MPSNALEPDPFSEFESFRTRADQAWLSFFAQGPMAPFESDMIVPPFARYKKNAFDAAQWIWAQEAGEAERALFRKLGAPALLSGLLYSAGRTQGYEPDERGALLRLMGRAFYFTMLVAAFPAGADPFEFPTPWTYVLERSTQEGTTLPGLFSMLSAGPRSRILITTEYFRNRANPARLLGRLERVELAYPSLASMGFFASARAALDAASPHGLSPFTSCKKIITEQGHQPVSEAAMDFDLLLECRESGPTWASFKLAALDESRCLEAHLGGANHGPARGALRV